MSLTEAFAQIWPIVLTLGGGYGGLILYIKKVNDERLRDKDEQIAQLRIERNEFKELALRSTIASERVSEAVSIAARNLNPGA